MESLNDLREACDEILIEELPPRLKAVIDRLLSRGVEREKVMTCLKTMHRIDGDSGRLLYLACEAYLERKGKEVED